MRIIQLVDLLDLALSAETEAFQRKHQFLPPAAFYYWRLHTCLPHLPPSDRNPTIPGNWRIVDTTGVCNLSNFCFFFQKRNRCDLLFSSLLKRNVWRGEWELPFWLYGPFLKTKYLHDSQFPFTNKSKSASNGPDVMLCQGNAGSVVGLNRPLWLR